MALGEVLGDWFRIRGSMPVPKIRRDGKLHTTTSEMFLPDELPAVRAVCWLSQVGSHKFVPVHLMHSPSHCPLAFPSEVLKNPIPLERPCAGGRKKKGNKTLTLACTVIIPVFAMAQNAFKGHNYIPGLEVGGPWSRMRLASGTGKKVNCKGPFSSKLQSSSRNNCLFPSSSCSSPMLRHVTNPLIPKL